MISIELFIIAIVIVVALGFFMWVMHAKESKWLEEQVNKLSKDLRANSINPIEIIESMPAPAQVNVNMKPVEDAIKGLPNKVLHSIQSSVNTKKGALGELIGYIELQAKYDRIIPLGNIVDFMCIKFPEINKSGMSANGIMEEGRVDFVDIKTGKSSRLSKDQRMLQQLIKDKKVNFVKVSVNTHTSENENESEPSTD